MQSFVLVAILALAASTNANIIAPSANILQGPSSRTTLVGPEGSVISSVAPGGQVVAESQPGLVAHAGPIAAAPIVSAYAAPVVSAYSSPVYAAHSARFAYSAPVASAYAAPILAGPASVNTVVAGPSGTIATSRGLFY